MAEPLIREPEQQEAAETCGTLRSNGKRCERKAGWGTDHPGIGKCRNHGGTSPSHRIHAAKEMLRRGSAFYGEARDVRPHEALLEEVRRTAGHVAFLSSRVADDDVSERERPVLLGLYHAERNHLVKVCQVALHAGVEERSVRVAERMGAELATLIGAILGDLALSKRQKAEAPEIVRRHLRVLEAGPT